jgi:two-component system LytT family response regulator
MSTIKTIIIDDEQLAIDIIRNYLISHEDVEIIAECQNGFDGLKAIHEMKPDLIFLDIMMPKLTGFEMLELLDHHPVIIFSTAYDQYALKAFEKNAIDYLLKPYAQDRLDLALDKARKKLKESSGSPEILNLIKYHQETGDLHRVVVRNGSKINIIAVDKIRYIEAMDDYVSIHTAHGKYLKQQTMKYFEQHLPANDFVRVHRSYILRLSELSKLEPYSKDSHVAVLKGEGQLPVSRSGYSRLKEILNF